MKTAILLFVFIAEKFSFKPFKLSFTWFESASHWRSNKTIFVFLHFLQMFKVWTVQFHLVFMSSLKFNVRAICTYKH